MRVGWLGKSSQINECAQSKTFVMTYEKDFTFKAPPCTLYTIQVSATTPSPLPFQECIGMHRSNQMSLKYFQVQFTIPCICSKPEPFLIFLYPRPSFFFFDFLPVLSLTFLLPLVQNMKGSLYRGLSVLSWTTGAKWQLCRHRIAPYVDIKGFS